jgi:hypothetical protein
MFSRDFTTVPFYQLGNTNVQVREEVIETVNNAGLKVTACLRIQ